MRYYNPMGLIDTDLLYRTLDAQRQARGLSWRDVAAETGLSAPAFSRLSGGLQPGLDGYIVMCRWLGMAMETFSTERARTTDGQLEPEFVLLLDRFEVTAQDREVLLAMVRAYLASRATSAQ